MNEDRITYAQLGQLTGSRDAPAAQAVRNVDHPRPRSRDRGNRDGAGPVSATSPQPPALQASLRQAGHLGRRHGRAAVYWQIGERSTGREFYRDLLRGIAAADPAITGLYEVPDLTGRWDYDRANLAADLHLAEGDPVLDPAAVAYLAAAREEFWREAAGWPTGT